MYQAPGWVIHDGICGTMNCTSPRPAVPGAGTDLDLQVDQPLVAENDANDAGPILRYARAVQSRSRPKFLRAGLNEPRVVGTAENLGTLHQEAQIYWQASHNGPDRLDSVEPCLQRALRGNCTAADDYAFEVGKVSYVGIERSMCP